jgi:hypothetical protein
MLAMIQHSSEGVTIKPSARVADFQRLFLVFGAVFVLQAV